MAVSRGSRGTGAAPSGLDALAAGDGLGPEPFVGVAAGDSVSRDALLRGVARLSAAPPAVRCVTAPDRAAVTAAVLAALRAQVRVLLAHAPDPPARDALAAAVPGLRFFDEPESAALWADGEPGPPRQGSRHEPGGHGAGRAPAASGDPDIAPAVGLLTGGTTGTPKILWKRPERLLGEVALWRERFALGPEDLVLATVTPLHIYGLIHSALLPALGGARAVRETPYLPAEVARIAAEKRPSVLVASPAHLRVLLASGAEIRGLRLVLSSGAPLARETALGVTRAWGAPVVEIYGSTETGAVATRCRAEGQESFALLPTVVAGFEGERMWVRSPYLADGLPTEPDGSYWVADRVVPDGAGGFRLAGRVDDVLKIAGKRVDLADLEGRVRALPGVRDVAVVAVRSPGARQVDVGVAVVASLPEAALREAVRGALRAVVRPRWVQPVERICRTPAGKVDRRAVIAQLTGGTVPEVGARPHGDRQGGAA